jgi:hypothetical protein
VTPDEANRRADDILGRCVRNSTAGELLSLRHAIAAALLAAAADGLAAGLVEAEQAVRDSGVRPSDPCDGPPDAFRTIECAAEAVADIRRRAGGAG